MEQCWALHGGPAVRVGTVANLGFIVSTRIDLTPPNWAQLCDRRQARGLCFPASPCITTATAPPALCSEELLQLLEVLLMPAAEKGPWLLQWLWTHLYQVR